MPFSTTVRPLVICLALITTLGLAACSDDGDNNSAGQSGGGGGSTEEYCTAMRDLFDLSQTPEAATMSDDVVEQMVDLLGQANTSAPPEVRRYLSGAFVGDSVAQGNLAEYNREQCGVGVSAP